MIVILAILIILFLGTSLLCAFPKNRIVILIYSKFEKQFFLNTFFPVCGTLFLTMILNIALINIDYFILNIWETIFIELIFSVLVFFLIDKMQENLMRLTFGETLNEFFSSIRHIHWVNKLFAKEFFRGIFQIPDYLRHALVTKDENSGHTDVLNFKSLKVMLNSLENDGVELSNYLYSRLLCNCLKSDCIHKIFSIWDIDMIGLDTNLYSEFTEMIGNKYRSIDDPINKQRVFIFPDKKTKNKIIRRNEWTSMKAIHQRWGFNKLHYCFKDQLDKVKEDAYEGANRLEDLLFCSNSRSKWGAGKDKESGKVFFISNISLMESTENIFSKLVKIADNNNQYFSLGEE